MANQKRVEKVEKVEDATLRQQLMSELELIDKMSTDKSPEQKKVEALLSSTTDAELRNLLEQRLQQMQSDGSMDIEEAIDEIQSLSLDPVSILQKGLSKDVNSRAYAAIKAQEDASE